MRPVPRGTSCVARLKRSPLRLRRGDVTRRGRNALEGAATLAQLFRRWQRPRGVMARCARLRSARQDRVPPSSGGGQRQEVTKFAHGRDFRAEGGPRRPATARSLQRRPACSWWRQPPRHGQVAAALSQPVARRKYRARAEAPIGAALPGGCSLPAGAVAIHWNATPGVTLRAVSKGRWRSASARRWWQSRNSRGNASAARLSPITMRSSVLADDRAAVNRHQSRRFPAAGFRTLPSRRKSAGRGPRAQAQRPCGYANWQPPLRRTSAASLTSPRFSRMTRAASSFAAPPDSPYDCSVPASPELAADRETISSCKSTAPRAEAFEILSATAGDVAGEPPLPGCR